MVQIDVDPSLVGLRLPIDAGVVADSRLALQGLLPRLQLATDRAFLEHYQREMDRWRREMTGLEDAALGSAVAELLAFPGPGIVDCTVNPNEPPMPGKVKFEQAKHFTEAFLRGQPHKVATIASVARDKINELRA